MKKYHYGENNFLICQYQMRNRNNRCNMNITKLNCIWFGNNYNSDANNYKLYTGIDVPIEFGGEECDALSGSREL